MIAAAIRKDMLLLLSDRSALVSLFLLPLVFMIVFGMVFQSTEGGPLGTLDLVAFAEDPAGVELAQSISKREDVELRVLASAQEVRNHIEAGKASAGLVFPKGFSPLSGVGGTIVLDRGISPQARVATEGALRGMVAEGLFGEGVSKLMKVENAQGGTTEGISNGFQISVPGNAVLFGFFLAITVALSFREDQRSGVFRRLLSSPVRPSALLLAKLVPFLFVGALQMLVLFGVGALVFGLELSGSAAGLLMLTVMVVACATSLGLLIASLGGSEKQVGSVGSIMLLVMGLLGGAMVPRMVMPKTMQSVGLATPHAWALDGYHALLVDRASSIVDIGPSLIALLAFTALFAALGVWRFRFDLGR